jgi:hypothetical protein
VGEPLSVSREGKANADDGGDDDADGDVPTVASVGEAGAWGLRCPSIEFDAIGYIANVGPLPLLLSSSASSFTHQ